MSSLSRYIISAKQLYRLSRNIYLLLFDHASIKSALSLTVNPTLLTRPKRAKASPTVSNTFLSSALISPGSLELTNESVLLAMAESSAKLSKTFVKNLSFFSAVSNGFEVL